MRSIVFFSLFFVAHVNASGAPFPLEIKGLTTGVTPAEFIAKVKSINNGCEIHEDIKKYNLIPGSVAEIRLWGSGCKFSATAKFGMVDQKSFFVSLNEGIPVEKNVITQDVASSLLEKYGDKYTYSFQQSKQNGPTQFKWFLPPGGGEVVPYAEYNSRGLNNCGMMGYYFIEQQLNDPRFRPDSKKFKNCVSFVEASIGTGSGRQSGFSSGYGVAITDVDILRKFWENDRKVIQEYDDRVRERADKASKENAPKI